VGEAGFEPALMLVTPGRLRNAKFKARHRFGAAKIYASGERWPLTSGQGYLSMLVTSRLLRI